MATQFTVTWTPSSLYQSSVLPHLPQPQLAALVASYACYQLKSVIQPLKTLPLPENGTYYSVTQGHTAFPTQLIVTASLKRFETGHIVGLIDIATWQFVRRLTSFPFQPMTAVSHNTYFQVADRFIFEHSKSGNLRRKTRRLSFSPSFFLLDAAREETLFASTDGKVTIYSGFPLKQAKATRIDTHSPVDFAHCIGEFLLTASVSKCISLYRIDLKVWKMENGALDKEASFYFNVTYFQPSFTLSPNRDRLLMANNPYRSFEVALFSLPHCTEITRTSKPVSQPSQPVLGDRGVYSHVVEDILHLSSIDGNSDELRLKLGEREFVRPAIEVFMPGTCTLLFRENTLYSLEI